MARTGRPKAPLIIDDADRDELQRLAARPSTPQSIAARARIVLACEQNPSNKDVAAALGVNEATVGKWRTRYIADGRAGLHDQPRPGRERTITDDTVEKLITATEPVNLVESGGGLIR